MINTNRYAKYLSSLLYEHLPLLAVLIVYLGAGFLLEVILDRYDLIHLEWSLLLYRIHIKYSAIFYLFFIFFKVSDYAINKSTHGNTIIDVFKEVRNTYFNMDCIGGFLIIFVLFPLFFSTFNSFKKAIPLLQPYIWDNIFMKMDFTVHLGHHPWEVLHPYFGNPISTKIIDLFYDSWFKVTFIFFLWQSWSTNRRVRAQFFLSWTLVWIFCGTVMATCLSSAGPCYYGLVTSGENPFQPLMAYLNRVHEASNLSAVHFQYYLWDNYICGGNDPFIGISAMPSIHVATVVLFVLVAWRVNCLLGIALLIYALIIQLGSVLLGWHYAIDGYIGAVLTILIWKITDRFLSIYGWIPSGKH